MLIANNRLPRRIYGNSSEVEKLVVNNKVWFDATTTFPVEGSLPKITYSAGTSDGHTITQGFIELQSQISVPDLLYKDSEGYCYVVDTETNTIKRFNTTLGFKPSHSYPASIIFDASTSAITIIKKQPIFLYGTNFLRVKAICCKYWPIVKSNIESNVTIANNVSANFGIVLQKSRMDVANENEGPQYNLLLKNLGTKNYSLTAKIGRLSIVCTRLIDDTATITLETNTSYSNTKEQIFIDGTQS